MAVPGSVERCSTVLCVRYPCCSCVVCHRDWRRRRRRQVAFQAPGGLPGACVVAVGAVLLFLLSLVSGSGLLLLICLHLGLFDVVCVALFLPRQCAFGVACRGWLLGALFVCSCSCIVGLAFRLGVCFLGFPAVVCAVTPFPTILSLCNTV